MPTWVTVDASRIRVERTRSFGEVWLARELMKTPGLSQLFREALPSHHAKIPLADPAIILVVARFCDVRSELSIAEHFYRSTALPDLPGTTADDVYANRLYRALDALLPRKELLQQRIKERFGDLFAIEYDILLYDVTSTYLEGAANANPDAQRGYSRDG